MSIIRILTLIVSLLLPGCTLTTTAAEEIPPTPTTVRVMAAGTPVPTVSRLFHQVTRVPTTEPEPTTQIGCPIGDKHTHHTIDAEMDYTERQIEVKQATTYINLTGEKLGDFVLNIEPNHLPQAFNLLGVLQKTASGKTAPSYTLTGRRLYLELVEPVEPGCELELELLFKIKVPQVGGGMQAYRGFFGHSTRQINLGHWLPTAAVRIGNNWITREQIFVGEHEVLEKADWDVTFTLTNTPEAVKVAAPGEVSEVEPGTWRYIHRDARDFTVSIGDGFRVNRATSKDGVLIELYTFEDAQGYVDGRAIDGAQHSLSVALRSLELYSDLFGLYPHKRMLIVQGDFPDGMEFSGLVFVSTDWFRSFKGETGSYLTLITVHEVAHQWWYMRVGNDPALSPWLDEALATYSEYLFIEEHYPALKDWWWQFRVNAYNPGGFVDSTVYEFTTIREYINAVYLRGVKMLHSLRTDLGNEAFFALLQDYVTGGDGHVVTPEFFWSLLTQEQFELTSRTRNAYPQGRRN
jgi:hypothetical protein